MPVVLSVYVFQPTGAGAGVSAALSVGASVGDAVGTAVALEVGHGVSVGLTVTLAEALGEAVSEAPGECCTVGEPPPEEQAAATARMAMVTPTRYTALWMPMFALPVPRLMTVWRDPLDDTGLSCVYRDQRHMESNQMGYRMP